MVLMERLDGVRTPPAVVHNHRWQLDNPVEPLSPFELDLGASSRTTVGPSTAGEGPDYESTSSYLASNQVRRQSPGLAGLRNIGNTCFLNSIVQCLSNTVLLRDYLVTKQYLRDIRVESRGDLIKSFSELLIEIWQGDQQVVNTTMFKSQIQRFAPRFMGYNQQDSQEFLRYLLEGLHQDVNQVATKQRRSMVELSDDMPISQKARESWRLYIQYENSKIVDLFVGQLRSVLTFSGCGHESVTFEPFWDLSLPLPAHRNDLQHTLDLHQCIEHFMREEMLDGEEMPICTKCNLRRRCTKRYSIQKFPKVLVLHLKRFGSDRFRNKLGHVVDFPITQLELGSYSSGGDSATVYDLYAVSNHSGSSQSGHYTAMCRSPLNHHWYLFNDSVVTPITPNRIPSGQAYVLFYQQNDTDRRSLVNI